MKPLTEKQQRVYDYVIGYLELFNVSPSIEEITEHFEWSSMTASRAHVQALLQKGYLTNTKFIRGLRPAQEGT